MSTVTSVLLTCSLNEPGIRWVNDWLEENEYAHLSKVNMHCGGSHAMGMEVWCGAYNYLSAVDFIRAVKMSIWRDRASVQLFLSGDQDDKFYGAMGYFSSWYHTHFWGEPGSKDGDLEEVDEGPSEQAL